VDLNHRPRPYQGLWPIDSPTIWASCFRKWAVFGLRNSNGCQPCRHTRSNNSCNRLLQVGLRCCWLKLAPRTRFAVALRLAETFLKRRPRQAAAGELGEVSRLQSQRKNAGFLYKRSRETFRALLSVPRSPR